VDIALKKNYSKFHSSEGTPLSTFTASIQEFILEFKYLPLYFEDEYIPADCEIGSRWYVEKKYCSEDILFQVVRKHQFDKGRCSGYAVINMEG